MLFLTALSPRFAPREYDQLCFNLKTYTVSYHSQAMITYLFKIWPAAVAMRFSVSYLWVLEAYPAFGEQKSCKQGWTAYCGWFLLFGAVVWGVLNRKCPGVSRKVRVVSVFRSLGVFGVQIQWVSKIKVNFLNIKFNCLKTPYSRNNFFCF